MRVAVNLKRQTFGTRVAHAHNNWYLHKKIKLKNE